MREYSYVLLDAWGKFHGEVTVSAENISNAKAQARAYFKRRGCGSKTLKAWLKLAYAGEESKPLSPRELEL